MTKALVENYGKEYINKAMSKDPVYFIIDYIELSKSNKKYPRYTQNFLLAVTDLQTFFEENGIGF